MVEDRRVVTDSIVGNEDENYTIVSQPKANERFAVIDFFAMQA